MTSTITSLMEHLLCFLFQDGPGTVAADCEAEEVVADLVEGANAERVELLGGK